MACVNFCDTIEQKDCTHQQNGSKMERSRNKNFLYGNPFTKSGKKRNLFAATKSLFSLGFVHKNHWKHFDLRHLDKIPSLHANIISFHDSSLGGDRLIFARAITGQSSKHSDRDHLQYGNRSNLTGKRQSYFWRDVCNMPWVPFPWQFTAFAARPSSQKISQRSKETSLAFEKAHTTTCISPFLGRIKRTIATFGKFFSPKKHNQPHRSLTCQHFMIDW